MRLILLALTEWDNVFQVTIAEHFRKFLIILSPLQLFLNYDIVACLVLV